MCRSCEPELLVWSGDRVPHQTGCLHSCMRLLTTSHLPGQALDLAQVGSSDCTLVPQFLARAMRVETTVQGSDLLDEAARERGAHCPGARPGPGRPRCCAS